ncbi:BCL2/adenovirus E1B 19 kDa protein-interacting protein 3-like [Ylistrum balloti]|uniref:BCL2/adenovirus E1B 19 kDa protein-interacting protein 3-like n=1 Tax=Ylistrum balloti TaxID=509963 RepID=UPI0029059D0B|nr:BCL2/adenovirus E1B 19 kDa protein-interacting protein 3-like [Ylistrum balloti]
MASTHRADASEDLHDSWVELNNSGPQDPLVPQSIYNGNLEKLLIDAQKESRTPSRANSKESSARGSPKSPHSPNNELATQDSDRDPGTDWIWDWSSRPEAHPPSDWNGRFKHRICREKMTSRNSRVSKSGVFTIDNLPQLLLTHACSFFLGAAVMFVCLKRYCSWTTVASPAMD